MFPEKKKIVVRCSSIGSCRRYLWYQLEHGKPKRDMDFAQRMFNGVILHAALEELAREMPDTNTIACDDTSFRMKLQIGDWAVVVVGTPDLVVEYQGSHIVIDFKGLSDWNMDAFEASSLTEHFKDQTNAYSCLVAHEFSDDPCLGAMIAARSKSSGEMKYKIVPYSIKRLRAWLKELVDAMSGKTTPLRDYPMDDFFCKWCAFRQKCWLLPSADMKNETVGIKPAQRAKFAKLAGLAGRASNSKSLAESVLGEIKRLLVNLHDRAGYKTLRADGAMSQVRHRKWNRLEWRPGAKAQYDKRVEKVLDVFLEKGKAKRHDGETSYLVVK